MADISRRDLLRMGMMSLPALGTLSVLGEALAAKTPAVGAIAENPSGAAEGEDIIIDGTAAQDYFRPHFSEWLQGGATCCAITLAGTGDGRKAIGNIEDTYRFRTSTPTSSCLRPRWIASEKQSAAARSRPCCTFRAPSRWSRTSDWPRFSRG